MQRVNAFSIDVEDYFQVAALAPAIPRDTWAQRDVNIALINELALIFNRLGIGKLAPKSCDVAVVAVAHREFRELGAQGVRRLCRKNHVVYDIKHVFAAAEVDGRL
jgi:UDP-N-acetyl-D-mannosaminuronate dehydrogenase